jgi:hypothetical protein
MMNGKVIALLLILLFVGFAFSTPEEQAPEDPPITPVNNSTIPDLPENPTPIVLPPPPTGPQVGKRLGMWMQWLSELQPVSVNRFVQSYFMAPPYFAAVEIIYPIWHPTYNTFIAWIDGVAEQVDAYPIEIYIMLALDMGDQEHWNKIESALELWQDNPSVYSVGVNCEHSKLHYPQNYGHSGFIQFSDLSHQYGKEFICYYFQNAPSEATKRDFKWIAHVNWPNLGHRSTMTVEFGSPAQEVGISAGLYNRNPDGYPDPDQPHDSLTYTEAERVGYNRASIQYVLDIAFRYGHEERRVIIFSQMDLWDHAGFRSDVEEVSIGYEITTAV